MTISITTNKTGPTAGDGAVTSFNYNFRIDDEDDLVVIHTDADGVESTLTITADYTVAGVGEAAGGTITYPVSGSPLPASETLTLKRVLALTQLTNLRNQGGYFPEVQEGALDRLEMQIQQLSEENDRALTVPPSTDLGTFSAQLPSPLTPSYFLAVNSGGTGLALLQVVSSGSVVISPFAETFLDDATASDVLTTLGVTAYAQTLLDDATAAAARTTLEIDGLSGKIVAGDLATDAIEAAKIKDLAVTMAKLANGAVDNTKLADMAAWTIKARNNAALGDPQDVALGNLTEEASPAAGHMLVGFLGTGQLRKFDVGNLAGGGGKVLQVLQNTKTNTASTTSATYGDTGLSQAITPANTANKILVRAMLNVGHSLDLDNGHFQLVRDSTAIGIGNANGLGQVRSTQSVCPAGAGNHESVILEWLDSPATVSAVTYKVQWRRGSTGTLRLNRSETDNDANFGRAASTLTLMEIDGT
jgi:hypothetical protein